MACDGGVFCDSRIGMFAVGVFFKLQCPTFAVLMPQNLLNSPSPCGVTVAVIRTLINAAGSLPKHVVFGSDKVNLSFYKMHP